MKDIQFISGFEVGNGTAEPVERSDIPALPMVRLQFVFTEDTTEVQGPLMTISPEGARLLGQQLIRNAKEALARTPKIRSH